MIENIEKTYNKLREKYKELPKFEELDNEFEISSLKKEDLNEKFLTRTIRRRMHDRFYSFNVGILSIISPSTPTIIVAHENKNLTDEDREGMMKAVKKLTKIEREYLILETYYDEANDTEFIKSSFGIWQTIKPGIKNALKKMKESWDMDEDSKKRDYFG